MWRIGKVQCECRPIAGLALILALVSGRRKIRDHRRAKSRAQFANACFAMAKPARLSSGRDPIRHEIETTFFPKGSFLRSRGQLERWTNPSQDSRDWQIEAQRLDDIERTTLNRALTRLHEPSLSNPRPDVEKAYRLTIVEGFDPPVGLRATKTASGAFLVVSGEGTQDAEVREISASQWSCLESLATEAQFWQLRAIEGWVVPDGPIWVLEGAEGSKYHAVARFYSVTPDVKDKVTRFCWYLKRLAGAG